MSLPRSRQPLRPPAEEPVYAAWARTPEHVLRARALARGWASGAHLALGRTIARNWLGLLNLLLTALALTITAALRFAAG